MITYTVRDRDTMTSIGSAGTLQDAVAQFEAERLAFLLNPPNEAGELELVISADNESGEPGDIVVRYAASGVLASTRR